MDKFGLATTIIDEANLRAAIRCCRERGIVLPTFAQLEAPESIDPAIAEQLAAVDPDAADARNLFRIHWFNGADRQARNAVPQHLILPEALTGVRAPIVLIIGDRFPMIGAHKVLAAYGCLAPRLATGQFDPSLQRAIWPSTGNYCRGGVAVSKIMGCRAVAVLPENMSRERFDWLQKWVEDPADIIRTPGSESNVREIYEQCAVLARDQNNVVLNQFCEFGNALIHYRVTGRALTRVVEHLQASHPQLEAHSFVSATGSAGTLAAGDRLKEEVGARIVAVEALECPTLLYNGFGEHNIQGIGDKHVPLIHNVFNTDDVVGVSDAATDALLLLAAHESGRRYLVERRGVSAQLVAELDHLGISSWANVIAAIKIARAYGLEPEQAILTVATDGADLYRSEHARIVAQRFGGHFDEVAAAEAFSQFVLAAGAEHHLELRAEDRRRIFNLGYFTWVEQQGVSIADFAARASQSFWISLRRHVPAWDERIREFNERVARA